MTITIDASRLTTKKPTGVERYTKAIIKGLLEKDSSLLLFTPRLIDTLPRGVQKILAWPIKKLWSQLRLGFELIFNPPRVFFSPSYTIPFLALLNHKTKKIVTIHDIAFMHLPQSYSWTQRQFLKLTTRQSVKYAHKIITPTQATKNDLIKYFNCPAGKIEVTYFGADAHIFSSESTSRKKQILYLGRIEDKKNIANLIDGFNVFNQKHTDYQLILAGKPGIGFDFLKAGIEKNKNINYLNYVDESKRQELLSQANCLVLVSKYEGFGLPLLEAFSFNLPTLASDIPVLREVGQDACFYVDPNSSQAIAQGLEKIIIHSNFRQTLVRAGKERLNFFSWQSCVDKTYSILKA